VILVFVFLSNPSLAIEDREGLPAELEDVLLRDGFFASKFKEAGTVSKITGKGRLIVVRRATREAFFAKEGNPVYENDALYTLTDCRCRITLKDKNAVTLAPDSHLDIDEVYASSVEGKRRSLLAMAKGKAIFYVLRLFTYRSTSLHLKTATAVIGVRGTKFGAEIMKVEGRDESYTLNRMVASLDPLLAEADAQKENIITRVYVLEGEVDVKSLIDDSIKRLHENEILEAGIRGLGEVVLDPERTRSFSEAVISGKESMPDNKPLIPDGRVQHEDVDIRERMEDIKQRERVPDAEHEHHEHPCEP
jgi:hypothetical protein